MMLDGTWGYVEVKPYGERGICVLVMVSGSPQVEVQSYPLKPYAGAARSEKSCRVTSEERRVPRSKNR